MFIVLLFSVIMKLVTYIRYVLLRITAKKVR